ncbi:MAG: beta-propeller domain-containing protein [Candidatus Thiodiazotropha endolucinida]|nr:beta-propeller domain-containing protein [Candidatus Thiodiazotropha taylori]MCW4320045.1 beta-propeller domain-containing protein [Candidatus Thiodiazotropha taylori]
MSYPAPRTIIRSTFAALLTLLIGCNSSNNQSSDNGGNTSVQSSAKLTRFESCEGLKSYLVSTAEQQNLLASYVAGLPVSVDDAANSPEPISFEEEQATIEAVTGTNNQVAGVDEADFIKTDGNHTYLLSGNYFMVLQTWPAAESQELSRTEIDGTPLDLLIYDDTAWVVSEIYAESYAEFDESLSADFAPRISRMTKITLLQISDPQQPQVIRETVVESGYVDALRIDHQVYLVVATQLDLTSVIDDPQSVEVEQLLPMMADNTDPDGQIDAVSSVISGCSEIYQPQNVTGTGTVSLLAFDLDNPLAELTSSSVLANSTMVYASQENLYIASIEDDNWLWFPVMEGEDYPTPSTRIHKFSLGSSPQYLASGSVEGHLLNKFSMDEYQGLLRVVTTELNWWRDDDPENRLFVLQQNDSQLMTHAELSGLGKPGERVFAVRFDQQRGFVVTFEQIDPLITLDLSDSANPQVAGELEVPGFSTYLHPIEGDRLLAIGQENLSIKLSLFDVSTLSQPILLSEHLIGQGSYSEAQYDHHAFTWFEQEKMLAIPVTQWNSVTDSTDFGLSDIFNGLELFRVTVESGIQPYAAIDHDFFYEDPDNGNWFYPEGIRRSFFVSDDQMNSYIYSISSRGMLVNDLALPENNIGSIELPYTDPVFYLF